MGIDRQAQEVKDQVPRLEAAKAAAGAASARVRQQLGVGPEEMSLADREVGLLELRESNRHSLQCVVELVKDYDEPELESTIAELMQRLELRPPSRPGSAMQLSVQSL